MKKNTKNEKIEAYGIDMDFILLSSGTFLMGESENKEQHEVIISKSFFMQTTPVTQAQWRAVMGGNPSYFKGDDRPVECVSWDDAQAFIKKLGETEGGEYRLPTEAEWEYACRAGSESAYCFGDDPGELKDYGWFNESYVFDENSGKETHPVGRKKANAWGLYDMHGNVWEWCQDWCDWGNGKRVITDTYKDGIIDLLSLEGADRVVRGGSWDSFAAYCRSAFRRCNSPGYRRDGLGFRLVLERRLNKGEMKWA